MLHSFLFIVIFINLLILLLNLGEYGRDLLVKQGLKTLFSLFVEVVPITEFSCQVFGCVSLVNNDTLRLLTLDAT